MHHNNRYAVAAPAASVGERRAVTPRTPPPPDTPEPHPCPPGLRQRHTRPAPRFVRVAGDKDPASLAFARSDAGRTDILISYTFKVAFGGGRGADYGFASALSVIIFMLVAAMSAFSFRYTRSFEEVR